MRDIFISYASEDRDRVEPLAIALEKEDLSVFWDRDILAGESYRKIIQEELESARCVIVVWSGNSISKDWVCDEAEEGKKKNILVPVSIEDVKIPLSFRSLQAANLVDWTGRRNNEKFNLLMQSITSILEGPSPEEKEKSAEKETEDASDESGKQKRQTAKPGPDPPERVKKTPPVPGRTENRKVAYGIGAVIIFIGIIALIFYRGQEPEEPISIWEEPILIEELEMEFVPVPPESFEKKNDAVEIPQPFSLQTTEVTQKQWKKIMGDNPSFFKTKGANRPVESVDWDKAKDFIEKLNEKYATDEYDFRLPTEDEWKYACRAETTTKFPFGDNPKKMKNYAWVRSNSKEKTHPVKIKNPNQWGLHDMHGNVMEWVSVGYDKKDPRLMGGSYIHGPNGANCGARAKDRWRETGWVKKNIGLRVAVSPKMSQE